MGQRQRGASVHAVVIGEETDWRPRRRRMRYASRSMGKFRRFDLAGRVGVLLLVSAIGTAPASPRSDTATPIKHLVVIFQENRSFDAYFATYPLAVNPPGQPAFRARPDTPSVNGLTPSARPGAGARSSSIW